MHTTHHCPSVVILFLSVELLLKQCLFVLVTGVQVISPSSSVLTQTNGFDCGLYVLRYMHSMLRLQEYHFTSDDLWDKFVGKITKSPAFSFDADSIRIMRQECFILIKNLQMRYSGLPPQWKYNHSCTNKENGTTFKETASNDDNSSINTDSETWCDVSSTSDSCSNFSNCE